MKNIGQFIPAFVIVLLMASEASAVSIVAPRAGSVVSGAVSIRLQVGTKVSWTQLVVDHVPVGSGYDLIGWDSTSVPNGTHLVAVKTYAKGSPDVLGWTGIYLVVRNGDSTHKTLVNPQNPRDYGATGNGSTDDTAAFRSAISHGDLHVTTGTYLINGGVSVPNYRNVQCDSGATLYTTGHSSTDSGILQWIDTGYGSVTGCDFKGSNTRPSMDGSPRSSNTAS